MTVQCYLPRRAFEALDHAMIRATARIVGVERPRWEWSTTKIPNYAPPASGCLTVNDEMAICLVEALQQQLTKAIAKANRELADETRVAIERLTTAIETAKQPYQSRSPGFGWNS